MAFHRTDGFSAINAGAATSVVDISEQFDGQRHRNWLKKQWYYRPNLRDIELASTNSDLYRHRDILGRVTRKPKDVIRHLNHRDGKPRRLVVQATEEALNTPYGDWRRTKIRGNASLLFRTSYWALKHVLHKKPNSYTASDWALIVGKILLISPVQMILESIPNGNGVVKDWYSAFPDRCWEYPQYARNERLDAKPNTSTEVQLDNQRYNFAGELKRLLRPRRLVVLRDEGAFIESEKPQKNRSNEPYLFISYTREHFEPTDHRACQPLYETAERMTKEAGLQAYWLDHLCITQERGAEQSEDIYRISDVIRGARQLIVVVPNLRSATLYSWGQRVWTLPEALLCENRLIKFCTPSGETTPAVFFAEHFTNSLALGRLELTTVALEALSVRKSSRFADGDLVYALMGLLSHRPSINPNDTAFQAFARLSLANDSDRLIERMMCMLPFQSPSACYSHQLSFNDQLGARLWDFEPLCQVAGVCSGSAVILDGCHGASIHWSDIPRIAFTQRSTWKKRLGEIIVRSGGILFLIGVVILASAAGNGSMKAGGAIILVVALLLTFSSPWTITRLYGGKVWGATPWLIGFEGTMRIREIERLAFGNAVGRLTYAPSSSLWQCREPLERIGREPAWIEDPSRYMPLDSRYGGVQSPATMATTTPQLPPGHRFFTLIDTATMTVTIFTATRPPSVALILGRESGMLRVALCHYDRSSATLKKETVVRMEGTMLNHTSK